MYKSAFTVSSFKRLDQSSFMEALEFFMGRTNDHLCYGFMASFKIKSTPPPPFSFYFFFFKFFVGGENFFSSGDFSWECCGTLPQNSYEPSHDL